MYFVYLVFKNQFQVYKMRITARQASRTTRSHATLLEKRQYSIKLIKAQAEFEPANICLLMTTPRAHTRI